MHTGGSRKVRAFSQWAENELKPTVTLAGDAEAIKDALIHYAGDASAIVYVESFRAEWASLIENAKCQFSHIQEDKSSNAGGSRTFKGVRVHRFAVADGRLAFENCQIGILQRGVGFSPSLRVDTTLINVINADGLGFKRIDWNGGFLGRINFGGSSPFRGDVFLKNVSLSTRSEDHGIQWLRDARFHLISRHNNLAAGQFHSSELRLTRPKEPTANRIAHLIYSWGSDYGNSIARPAGWLATFLTLICCLAFVFGTQPMNVLAERWSGSLYTEETSARILRSGLYSIQSVFNPLQIFSTQPLVSVRQVELAIVCSALGLLGTVAFALLLLSLRRRFKLE